MTDHFELTVFFKGEERNFDARLQILGYTHKFLVLVNGIEVFYEPDEEGDYRVVINPESMKKNQLDIELLKAIRVKLKTVLS